MSDIKVKINDLNIDITVTDQLLGRILKMYKPADQKPATADQKPATADQSKLQAVDVAAEINQEADITKEELSRKLGELMSKVGKEKIVSLMNCYGGKLDQVDPSKYPQLLEDINRITMGG